MPTRPKGQTHRIVAAAAVAAALALFPFGSGVIAQEVDTGDGEAVYASQCAACHQATGAGVPGAFPPLAGHVYEFQLTEEAREYPILVVLYGLAGPITVHGQEFAGMMPSMGHLGDEQIADVLNYLMVAWDDIAQLEEGFVPYTATEVGEERGRDLTPAEVHAIRMGLELE